MLKHRNSQKRIYIEDASYFITCKTQGSFPYFEEGVFCDLFVENLRLCKQLKQFYLYGWVLIYDHFHLLFRPGHEFNFSKMMQFLKRHVSRNINIIMDPEGAIRESRLRGGHYKYYQSIINNHDKKIIGLKKQFDQKHGNLHSTPHFQWQKSFHPPEPTIRYGRATITSEITPISPAT